MHPWQKLPSSFHLFETSSRTDPYDSSRLQISDVRSKIGPDDDEDEDNAMKAANEASDSEEYEYPRYPSNYAVYQMRAQYMPSSSKMEIDHPPQPMALSSANYGGSGAGSEPENGVYSMGGNNNPVAANGVDHQTTPSSGSSRRRAALAGESRTRMALAFEDAVSTSPSRSAKQTIKAKPAATATATSGGGKSFSSRKSHTESCQDYDSSEDIKIIGTAADEAEMGSQVNKRPFWCHVCGTRFVDVRFLPQHYKTEDHLLKRDVVGMGDAADQDHLYRQARLLPFHCLLCKKQFLHFLELRDHFDDNHQKHSKSSDNNKRPRKIWEDEALFVLPPPATDDSRRRHHLPSPGKKGLPPSSSRASTRPRRSGTRTAAAAAAPSVVDESDSDAWSMKPSTSSSSSNSKTRGTSSSIRSSRSAAAAAAKALPDGPYKCDPCKVSFNRLADLKRHFGTDKHCFTETGVRARRGITCTVCDTSFTRLDAAYRHVQRSHAYEFEVYGADIIEQTVPEEEEELSS